MTDRAETVAHRLTCCTGAIKDCSPPTAFTVRVADPLNPADTSPTGVHHASQYVTNAVAVAWSASTDPHSGIQSYSWGIAPVGSASLTGGQPWQTLTGNGYQLITGLSLGQNTYRIAIRAKNNVRHAVTSRVSCGPWLT